MEKFSGIEEIEIEEIVKATAFAQELDLEIVCHGDGQLTLKTSEISRPGLQLSGYYSYFDGNRVQVIGQTEHRYLETLPLELRKQRIDDLFNHGTPCVIFTHNLIVEDYVIQCAEKYGMPVFRSHDSTTVLVKELFGYLSKLLAERTQVHGVLVEVLGAGALIVGDSGVGKSEVALDLVKRGNRLVSDDVVIIKKVGKQLIGTAPELVRHFMEVRGIGIINIGRLYGGGAVKYIQEVELIIELEKWEEGKEYERLGVELTYDSILGVKIPKYVIPVTPGRNVAIILETIVAELRMRLSGYNAAVDIEKRATTLLHDDD